MKFSIVLCLFFAFSTQAESPLSLEFHKSWKLMVQHQSHYTFQNRQDHSIFITVATDKVHLKPRTPSAKSERQIFIRQLGHKNEKTFKAKKYTHKGYQHEAFEQTFLYRDRRGRKRQIEQHRIKVKDTLVSYTLLYSSRSSKHSVKQAQALLQNLTYTDFTK